MPILRIEPTKHYEKYHNDVDWHLVYATIFTSTRRKRNKRRGKNRFTYEKEYKKCIVEVHLEIDYEGTAWVINAFKNEKK